MKKLKELMTKKDDQVLTSVKVERNIYYLLKTKLKKDKLTFQQLVAAAAKQYLEEK